MKNCKNCGEQIGDEEKVCPKCGFENEAEQDAGDTETPKDPVPYENNGGTGGAKKKKIFLFAAIGAAAALLILIIILIASSGASKPASADITVFNYGENVYIVNTDGKTTVIKNAQYSEYNRIQTDAYKNNAVIAVKEDGEDVLYYYNGKGVQKIVTGALNKCLISMDGKRVVYELIEEDAIYSFAGGKSAKTASEARLTAISPDGRTVAYYKTDGEDTSAYYNSGKEQLISKNALPVAIANNGKYVYFVKTTADGDTNLYVQKGTDDSGRTKLCGFESDMYIAFNSDLSEAIFNNGGKTYVTKKGGSTEKISSSEYRIITLAKYVPYYYYSNNGGVVVIYDANTLKSAILVSMSYNKIALFNGSEAETVLNSDGIRTLTEDVKTVFYVKNSVLYKKNVTSPDSEPQAVLEDGFVSLIDVSENGDIVLYRNDDNEYAIKKGSGKAVRIGDRSDIDEIFLFKGKVYYVSDEKLYTTSDGKNKKSISLKSSVEKAKKDGGKIFVDTENGKYVSANGSSFDLIAKAD